MPPAGAKPCAPEDHNPDIRRYVMQSALQSRHTVGVPAQEQTYWLASAPGVEGCCCCCRRGCSCCRRTLCRELLLATVVVQQCCMSLHADTSITITVTIAACLFSFSFTPTKHSAFHLPLLHRHNITSSTGLLSIGRSSLKPHSLLPLWTRLWQPR